jgi:hypothetical protein
MSDPNNKPDFPRSGLADAWSRLQRAVLAGKRSAAPPSIARTVVRVDTVLSMFWSIWSSPQSSLWCSPFGAAVRELRPNPLDHHQLWRSDDAAPNRFRQLSRMRDARRGMGRVAATAASGFASSLAM